ncbi:DUF418 domain-containing protein [Streptomyces sp. IB201691-2A2]|uniref:DUF418 domain-containing protein n=1 Tax=Streptomyces sp. IB201691-2A2 TaxID=2561920 RepID=UPI00117CF929|nr:DUF418 domain-containing protein [Streptomyces sp. IB201691-2A2]TRO56030.1 DUF418 domain-containing protein [Streptomyces sp. IB201691-2A2]
MDANTVNRRPRSTVGRITEIDALRGFALLGICMVNAPVIAGAWGAQAQSTTADHLAAWLITALFTSKFYLLFAFLFGYNFTLQMRFAEQDKVSFGGRHARRLAGLFLLGAVHAVLLYPGDILMMYALLGLALFTVRGMRTVALLRIATLLVLCLAALLLAIGLWVLTLPDTGQAISPASTVASNASGYRSDPLSIVSTNLHMFKEALASAALYSAHVFAAFQLGFVAGRRCLLESPGESNGRVRAMTRRLLWAGLLIGVPGSVFTAMCSNGPFTDDLYFVGQAVNVITAPALAAAYGCALLLLARGRHGPRLVQVLAPAGRMSLSNYLAQSLVLAYVFTGYGLGLFGRVGPAILVGVCLLLYTGQLAVSAWIMSHFRQGPVESLLHRITSGRSAR